MSKVPPSPGGPSGPEHSRALADEALGEHGLPVTASRDLQYAALPAGTMTPREERRAERRVAFWFLLSTAAAIGFVALIWVGDEHAQWYNPLLGVCLGLALAGLGIGAVLWSKTLMGDEEAVQEREPFAPPAADRERTAQVWRQGVARTGIARRKLLRRSLLTASGALLLPALGALRQLGPRPNKQLTYTAWSKGARLVNDSNVPVKLGDIEVGGFTTVFPENHVGEGLSPTLLIRLGATAGLPAKERAQSAEGHVAYSKICTHLGCPIGLYLQQSRRLLCPCHQSLFDVSDDCKVLFGPATRPLPQLPIEVDKDGYFRALGDYPVPVGPGFWERK